MIDKDGLIVSKKNTKKEDIAMKKIILFSLGFLIVGGYFNISFAYQDQIVSEERYRPEIEYACNDLVVRIHVNDFIQDEPTEVYHNIPNSLLPSIAKGIHRALILEFHIMNGGPEPGRIWPVYGGGSNISIVIREPQGTGIQTPIPENYGFIAQRLVNKAVSDGLAWIIALANQFHICQLDDKGISLRLESVDRTNLSFMTLKTFEAIADQERQSPEDTLYNIDITGLISRAFFDQLTPEYLNQLKDIISM